SARDELQRYGLVRRLKIIDIDPVRRSALALGDASKKAQHRLVLTRAIRSQHKNIVALAANSRAEAQRLKRALLPYKPRMIFKVERSVEIKMARIAGAIEKVGGHGINRHSLCLASFHCACRAGSAYPYMQHGQNTAFRRRQTGDKKVMQSTEAAKLRKFRLP